MKSVIDRMAKKPLKKLDSAQLTLLLQRMVFSQPENFEFTKVQDAIELAAYLHEGQTRANRANLPRTPYIEHPLRNAIRVLRWGVKDENTLNAAILHDVVEDSAKKIYELVHARKPEKTVSEEELREVAIQFISDSFGAEVARIVLAVSNDILPKDIERVLRYANYLSHVRDAIRNDPAVFIVKLSDFVDNACGLYHNDFGANREKIVGMATKYLPVVDVFENELPHVKDGLMVDDEVIAQMYKHLSDARTRLIAIIEA
ncbi:MAG: HD domain-containing protein [Enterococcus sp.]|nr:HD domain-containing protein [Enterococcus sp.]